MPGCISNDKRPIKSIYGQIDQAPNWTVGTQAVEKIEVYDEPHMEFWIPWIAIWIKGEIAYRCDAKNFLIEYRRSDEGVF